MGTFPRRMVAWLVGALLAVPVGPSEAADVGRVATAAMEIPANSVPYPPGATDVSILYGGERRFRVYVPASLGGTAPRAIVVALHGGGGRGLETSEPGQHPLAVFRDVADREGFVVVYPEGSRSKDGKLGWTDCRSDNTQASGADDVGFLRAVVGKLRSDYSLPTSRIFLAGTSNGGQMALAFAAAATGDVAGIAVSSANLPQSPLSGTCSTGPSKPLPAIFTHGSADPAMPYGGGCVANLGGGCARGRVIGAESTRDFYLAVNGLTATVPETGSIDIDMADAGAAERFAYAGPAPVEWWRLDEAGHPPPSRSVFVDSSPLSGVQNRDIEFAEIAWAFFASVICPPDGIGLASGRDDCGPCPADAASYAAGPGCSDTIHARVPTTAWWALLILAGLLVGVSRRFLRSVGRRGIAPP